MHLVLVFVIACPVAWLLTEFQERRWLRILVGIAAIACCFGVAALVGALQMFNANVWYSNATKELVDTTIAELEAGNQASVLASLKDLQQQFVPGYESRRAEYNDLIGTAVKRMKSDNHKDREATPQKNPSTKSK